MKVIATILLSLAAASASSICSQESIGFTYPHPRSCTKFHQCTPAGDLVFECQEGTFFNRETKVCDCGTGKTCWKNSYEKCPLTVETKVCEGKAIGEMVDHPHTCDAFYHCSQYGPALFSCPEGTSFNTKTKTCDVSKNAKCARKARACCGSSMSSGCCGGGNQCRPCGGWMMQQCCVPCVPCMPCFPCNGGGGGGDTTPVAPENTTTQTTTTTTTVTTTTTQTTTTTTTVTTTTTNGGSNGCQCPCVCPPIWVAPCQCRQCCPPPRPPPCCACMQGGCSMSCCSGGGGGGGCGGGGCNGGYSSNNMGFQGQGFQNQGYGGMPMQGGYGGRPMQSNFNSFQSPFYRKAEKQIE